MRMNTKRPRKSISWAPGVKLCQVRQFSSLDRPVEVGMKYQGHCQSKTSTMSHSSCFESDERPPGFEASVSVISSGCRGSSSLRSSLSTNCESSGEACFYNDDVKVERLKQSKLPHLPIPQVKWQCPPKLIMIDDWCVAAGEESEEAKAQQLREMRVLEAVYPRFSAIPPSPSFTLDVECECYDQNLTPCVPINAIEEEPQEDQEYLPTADTNAVSELPGFPHGLLASGTVSSFMGNPPVFGQVHVPGKLHKQSADFTAITSAALTAVKESGEKGSMIDTDLLIKILKDPKMLQKLINVHGPQANTGIASSNTHSAPSPKTVTPYVPSSLSVTDMQRIPDSNTCQPGKVGAILSAMMPVQPDSVQLPGLKRPAPSTPLPSLSSPLADHVIMLRLPDQVQTQLSALPRDNMAPLGSFPVQEPGIMKDMNYYKNLIRQHGTENKEMQDTILLENGNSHYHLMDLKMSYNCNPAEMKTRKLKNCMFFKTVKGCRKGSHCEYHHDMSLNWRTGMEAQSAKRMKLNGVSTGRGMF